MILCTERISSQCLSGITEIKSLAENVIWSRWQKWEIGEMKYGMRNCTMLQQNGTPSIHFTG